MQSTWLKIERQFLTNIWEHVETDLFPACDDRLVDLLTQTIKGNYAAVIENSLNSELIKNITNNNLKDSISKNIELNEPSSIEWFLCAASSLLYFVQCNWTGPIPVEDLNCLKTLKNEAVQNLLLQDGYNENVINLESLYLAKVIFGNHEIQRNFPTSLWWLFRSNLLHQIVLEEYCPVLFDESEELIKQISQSDTYDNILKTLFNLDAACFYFYFKRVQSSAKYVEAANNAAEISMELAGALGKRTKYQHCTKAQLYLSVNLNKEKFLSNDCAMLPKVINLSDDLRLEQIEFTEARKIVELGAIEEAVVVANFFQLKLSQPNDQLQDEELSPYLNIVIDNTKNWPLKVSALSQRCVLESTHKRTIERALCQMEYLIKQIESSETPIPDRMNGFFSSGAKPIWRLKQILGDLMLSIGMVKGALDLYLKLSLWEEVIVCYAILNLKHKAAEIIRQELNKKPTVKLWCLLGDVTQDEQHYETAWKLSDEKSSRAQRHWGFFHFSKKNYKEAVEHLRISVELNNIQENVWVRLGFAAMQIEDWKLAASAYRSYCALEQSNFEVWNNLAKAYIKLGDKPRARRALQDAVKCNFDRWEVWDNLKVVSVDTGHFSDVIGCYFRILELKGAHEDVEVLGILTNAIVNDIKDAEGNPARNLLQETLKLFGYLTSLVPSNAAIWKFYAELTCLRGKPHDNQNAAQHLERAFKAAVSNPRWFKTVNDVKNVMDICIRVAETCLKCSENFTDSERRTMLLSCKLRLNNVVVQIKKQDYGDRDDEIQQVLEQGNDMLSLLVTELDKIKTCT